jgi:polyhydroxybutyrate depolymerase
MVGERFIPLLVVLVTGCGDGTSSPGALPDVEPNGSPGCGLDRAHAPGGVQVTHPFSALAGGQRSFFLSVPESYDPSVPQRLIVGYAGTNWLGEQIAPYFSFESASPQAGEIYVYPDLQWHEFDGWGNLGGWLLGPHASPADGMADIEFTRELVGLLGNQYCIDTERVFAAGHSWGGDMAAVVGCFLGDLFTAVAPAAANRPYWFEPEQGDVECSSSAAVWAFFGQNDPHFSQETYPGQFGDEQVTFWKALHDCDDSESELEAGAGECVQYGGCSDDTRYCFYSPETGHQIPSYFSTVVLEWFRQF